MSSAGAADTARFSGIVFRAVVEDAGGGGHAVVVPPVIADAFAVRRPAVLATVDGTPYRSRLAVYGGVSYLGLRKDLLAAIGRGTGDEVEITLVEDSPPPP